MPASTYTRAKLFQTKGRKTPVSVRFSTVIGGRDSSEAARDPRGIPANYRTQDGFGVNTYRMVNTAGEGVLVKYHWKSRQGVESLTEEQAAAIQATELGHASKDSYEAIERGEYPRWELNVQIMSDDEHPELDFDPLDDTKTWPEDVFPLRPVGVMTLNRNVTNFHNENEQIAFGTGVLVDGLDFSDDKMLVGRTFSYSDTQRYRVGPNYLQLPVNAPREDVQVSTNQEDFEPSSVAGLREADESYREYRPHVSGQVMRAPIERQNDYAQAGERFRTMPEWERDDLVKNMTTLLGQCDKHIQEKMVWHFSQCDEAYGRLVAEGLGIAVNA